MKVSLIGATGATGKDLLALLLSDGTVTQIDIFVRREINLKHKKLNVHIIDFEQHEQWKYLVTGDVLLSCLGTTLKDAGSKAKQWKVDYDYQYQFAKAARENNVCSYVLVSSAQASKSSTFFYAKMKGQLEEDVKKLNFQRLIIFNPPLLIRKGSNRAAEVIVAKALNFATTLGFLKAAKPMKTYLLAHAMLNAVKSFADGAYSIKGQQIIKYAK